MSASVGRARRLHETPPMRASATLVGLLTAASIVVSACSSDDGTTSAPDTRVDLCQGTRAIGTAFGQGDGLAEKTLALTFDDGPAEVTSELSAYLRSEGIAATFFVNGANVEGLENVLPQLVADGHLIGNHTQTHAALTSLSSAEAVDEVSRTDALIAELAPKGKLFFRPPFGDWSEDVQAALAKSAMNKYHGPIGWDIGDHLGPDAAADWDCWDAANGSRTVAECGALYLQEIEAKKKGIVLLHDGPPRGEGEKTLAMIQAIVPKLKDDGYRFARIDEVPFGGGSASGAGTGGGGVPTTDPCAQR